MAKDETIPEATQETQSSDTSTEASNESEGSKEQTEEQEDYRGKLNATNRFLETEGYEFKDGKWVRKPAPASTETTSPTSTSESSLTPKDQHAMLQAQVHVDDFDEVIKAAKLLGKSVADALKDTTVLAILKKRTEERKTAEATATRTSRPSTKQRTPEEIRADAAKGNVPEKGTKEADDLFWARRGGKPA